MRIIIHDHVRKDISDDEYKLLLLLEFNQEFISGVRSIRKKLNIMFDVDEVTIAHRKEVPDLKALNEEVFLLVQKLGLPITLISSIESIVQWGQVLMSTIPINVFGRQHRYNRKLLSQDNNLAQAYPVIQIHKKITKAQLIKSIEEKWEEILKAMDELEESVSLPVSIQHIPIREIEEDIKIYRYRKDKMPYKTISKEFHLEEETLRQKYSRLHKVLQKLGFVTK